MCLQDNSTSGRDSFRIGMEDKECDGEPPFSIKDGSPGGQTQGTTYLPLPFSEPAIRPVGLLSFGASCEPGFRSRCPGFRSFHREGAVAGGHGSESDRLQG